MWLIFMSVGQREQDVETACLVLENWLMAEVERSVAHWWRKWILISLFLYILPFKLLYIIAAYLSFQTGEVLSCV